MIVDRDRPAAADAVRFPEKLCHVIVSEMVAAPTDRARHTVAPDPGRVVTKAVLRAAEELGDHRESTQPPSSA